MITIFLVFLGIWGIGQAGIGIVWIAMGLIGLVQQAFGSNDEDR